MELELKHHWGWEPYRVPHASSLAEAAYWAVCESHNFLAGVRHTHTTMQRTDGAGCVEVAVLSQHPFKLSVEFRPKTLH